MFSTGIDIFSYPALFLEKVGMGKLRDLITALHYDLNRIETLGNR